MKMKKMHLRHLKLRNFMRIQKLKKMKKQLSKVPNVTYNEFENTLECDLGKHLQIWQYPPNQIDEV